MRYVISTSAILLFFKLYPANADPTILPAGSPTSHLLTGQPVNPLINLIPFALMFGVVYFLIIRPQQKRLKETQRMLSQLKIGDQVVTNAGIIGTITEVSEKTVLLEIAQNVQCKFLKAHISGNFQSLPLIQ